MPIRVAHIMGKLWAGGVEMVVFNYYRAIDKRKIQFDFFYDSDSTVEPPKDLIEMGARFYKIPPYQNIFIYLKSLSYYFKKNKYKIVHSHINTLSVFPLFVAWYQNIPIRIAHNHSVPGGNELIRNLLKYFLKFFAKIFPTHYFACSEKSGRWLFGNSEFDSGNVCVLKNSIDFSKFRYDQKRRCELIEKYDLGDKFVVCHVGRFTFAKNHKRLIEIFSKLVKKIPQAILFLVGDGELHKDILDQINKLKLNNNVICVGQVTNPFIYYSIANVVVLPSLFEGLSLVTIESQAAGVPVAVSEFIPNEAIISNGVKQILLSDCDDVWVEEIINISKLVVTLDDRANKYDVNSSSKFLAGWYLEHYKK